MPRERERKKQSTAEDRTGELLLVLHCAKLLQWEHIDRAKGVHAHVCAPKSVLMCVCVCEGGGGTSVCPKGCLIHALAHSSNQMRGYVTAKAD